MHVPIKVMSLLREQSFPPICYYKKQEHMVKKEQGAGGCMNYKFPSKFVFKLDVDLLSAFQFK